MRAVETDHVGDQLVRIAQRAIGRQRHRRVAVPAEGFQRLGDEALRVGLAQAAVALAALDQLQRAFGEDAPLREDLRRLRAQRRILDQFQPQQRGEHAERIALQRRRVERPECGGMHRHASHRQVVIADRMHAHHREQPAQRSQFLGAADTDRTMPFLVQPRTLAVALQLRVQRRIGGQGRRIDLRHQFHQRAVQRHLGAVHVGHGLREQAADGIGRNEGSGHREVRSGGSAGHQVRQNAYSRAAATARPVIHIDRGHENASTASAQDPGWRLVSTTCGLAASPLWERRQSRCIDLAVPAPRPSRRPRQQRESVGVATALVATEVAPTRASLL